MASRVKEAAGVLERVLLPRLNSIDGELKSLNTRIDSSTNELRAEIKAVDTKVSEMDKRLTTRIDSVDGKIGSLRSEISSEMGSVRGEVGSVRGEVGSVRNEMGSMRSELLAGMSMVEKKVDSLAGRFDLFKDVEELKVKVAELEKRR